MRLLSKTRTGGFLENHKEYIMKIAFYLISFYGSLAFLATVWGQAAIEKYKAKHAS
jgi:hypothetical protein